MQAKPRAARQHRHVGLVGAGGKLAGEEGGGSGV